jgi:hypothetical protein
LGTLPLGLARAGDILARPLERETSAVPAARVTPRLSIKICSLPAQHSLVGTLHLGDLIRPTGSVRCRYPGLRSWA